MKKFLTILFALLLALSALSFAACGSDSSKDPDNPDNPGKAEIYTISYEFGDMEGKAEVTIARKSFTVKSGESFTLDTPNPSDKFEYWVIKGTTEEFKSGVFTLDKDVTLVAVWKVETPEY